MTVHIKKEMEEIMKNKVSMKTYVLTIFALLTVFLTVWPLGLAFGQEEPPGDGTAEPPSEEAVQTEASSEVQSEPELPEGGEAIEASISPVMGYQGRLLESGASANGTRSMTFRLYNLAVGGTILWGEGPESVQVTHGLFSTVLGDSVALNPNIFDQALWLEIVVEGVTLPRQPLMGSPYALSLAPNADVTGDTMSLESLLFLTNTGSGRVINAIGNGSGSLNPTLRSQNQDAAGIAHYALNDSSDATILAENDGAGPLFKGFGGDGGDEEFRLDNDGSLWQARTADGLAKAAAYVNCSNSAPSILRSFTTLGAAISVVAGAVVGDCIIDFGAQIDDRYFVVSAFSTSGPRAVTCRWGGSTAQLWCRRWDEAGDGQNGNIMVVIY
jgi:hypothetical protein